MEFGWTIWRTLHGDIIISNWGRPRCSRSATLVSLHGRGILSSCGGADEGDVFFPTILTIILAITTLATFLTLTNLLIILQATLLTIITLPITNFPSTPPSTLSNGCLLFLLLTFLTLLTLPPLPLLLLLLTIILTLFRNSWLRRLHSLDIRTALTGGMGQNNWDWRNHQR